MTKFTTNRISSLPIEVIYISGLFDDWKVLKEFHQDPPPDDDEAAMIVFKREIMKCHTVPVRIRVQAREWLQGKGVLDEVYPLTPEEILKAKEAVPIFGSLRKEVKKYKLIVLLVEGADRRLIEHVYLKVIDLFVGSVSAVSSYSNKTITVLGTSCTIKIVHVEDTWVTDYDDNIGYRVVSNVLDV